MYQEQDREVKKFCLKNKRVRYKTTCTALYPQGMWGGLIRNKLTWIDKVRTTDEWIDRKIKRRLTCKLV